MKPQRTQAAEAQVFSSFVGFGAKSLELLSAIAVGTGRGDLSRPRMASPSAPLVREKGPLSWLVGLLAFIAHFYDVLLRS